MKKYGFKIIGDNGDEFPVLFECTFLAREWLDIERFQRTVLNSYNHPQDVGMRMVLSDVYEVKDKTL